MAQENDRFGGAGVHQHDQGGKRLKPELVAHRRIGGGARLVSVLVDRRQDLLDGGRRFDALAQPADDEGLRRAEHIRAQQRADKSEVEAFAAEQAGILARRFVSLRFRGFRIIVRPRTAQVIRNLQSLGPVQPFDGIGGWRGEVHERRLPGGDCELGRLQALEIDLRGFRIVAQREGPLDLRFRQRIVQRLAVAQQRARRRAIEPEAVALPCADGVRGPERHDRVVVDRVGRDAAAAGQERPDDLGLAHVIAAAEPLGQPGIEARLQRARDIVGRDCGRAHAQERRQLVGNRRVAQRVVQHVEERGQARHLDIFDLEAFARDRALRLEGRLLEANPGFAHLRDGRTQAPFTGSRLHDLLEMPSAQGRHPHIDEPHVIAPVRQARQAGKAHDAPDAAAELTAAVRDPAAQHGGVVRRAPQRAGCILALERHRHGLGNVCGARCGHRCSIRAAPAVLFTAQARR